MYIINLRGGCRYPTPPPPPGYEPEILVNFFVLYTWQLMVTGVDPALGLLGGGGAKYECGSGMYVCAHFLHPMHFTVYLKTYHYACSYMQKTKLMKYPIYSIRCHVHTPMNATLRSAFLCHWHNIIILTGV